MALTVASDRPFGISKANLDEKPEPQKGSTAHSVHERVNEIFGYDFFEERLIAEGAREMAEESLLISESNLAAGTENLPPE